MGERLHMVRFLTENLNRQNRIIDQIVVLSDEPCKDMENYTTLFGHRFAESGSGNYVSMTAKGIEFRILNPTGMENDFESFFRKHGKGSVGFRERINLSS